MKSLYSALKEVDDPFDGDVDPELLRQAEARARAIREQEAEEEIQAEVTAALAEPVAPAAAAASAAETQEREAQTSKASTATDQGAEAEVKAATPAATAVPAESTEVSSEAPAMAPELAATALGSALAKATVIHEREQVRSLHDMKRAGMGVDGLITRGDEPLRLPKGPLMSYEESLKALGIPPRPQTWPVVMAWPSQRVLDRFMAPGVTIDQKAQMVRELMELNERMLRRSRQIKEWLERHNPLEEQDKHSQNVVKAATADPHYGIRWATLINPGIQDKTLMTSVLSWGYCTAKTADGGSMRVHEDSISFGGKGLGPVCYTPQSVSLAIREAQNRGWGKINMQGSYEFGMMAIKAAKEAGIEATISYAGRGVMSWKTYTVKVMPNAPMPEMVDPHQSRPDVASPDAGSSPEAGPAGKAGEPKVIPDRKGPSPIPGAQRARKAAEPAPAEETAAPSL